MFELACIHGLGIWHWAVDLMLIFPILGVFVRFLWCIDCGLHFKQKKKAKECKKCGYDEISEIEKEDYLEHTSFKRVKLLKRKRIK